MRDGVGSVSKKCVSYKENYVTIVATGEINAMIRAWKCYFPPFWEIMTDRPTDGPTIQPTNRPTKDYQAEWSQEDGKVIYEM